jgi:pyruvate/2-oxoglutarate dehydrogenase complex dihydrolipoamide acyltransferase (E2) component
VLATWFVVDGQQVKEAISAEVAVDTVDVELKSPASGIVRLLVREGGVLGRGALVARTDS